MSRNIDSLRNIGIIAHIDAGKTTLTERMLFYSGATHRMGDVDKGTTVTDFDPEEQQRGITIQAACVTFRWGEVLVNLIDTPGHVDFTAEVERSLRVLDGGVVVFSAREGVEAQSETVWRQADKYGVPRIAFINKMDREGADFFRTLDEIRDRLDSKPVAVQLPAGAGPPHLANPFHGVIDLIEMQWLVFDPANQGVTIDKRPIPEAFQDEAELWRGQMLDQLFEYSDRLVELALAEEPIPPELLRQVIRDATVHRLIIPVLCGSALDYQGVQPVLDGVAQYLPSPKDRPAVEGENPKKKNKETRAPDPEEPFCGLVFKIQADKHGDLHYVRVYSGTLKEGTRVLNPGKDARENVQHLWHIQADRREKVAEVEAGDIVGIVGLQHSITGDTLCHTQHPILLETIRFPETVISMAIEAENSTERKKLATALEMMKRQDPTFRARENPETGQTLISGMGELHLEIIKNRLLRDFHLNVRVHKPRVSYRETVEKSVVSTGEAPRLIGGTPLFAKVRVRLEPFETGEKPVLVVNQSDGSIPEAFVPAVMDTLQQRAEGGGSLSFPLMKLKITLLGGEANDLESNEVAFRHAAADAFNSALNDAGIVLLEPLMRLEITSPEEHVGDFVGDLQQRRGMITHTTIRGKNTVIEAQAPLANLFGYSGAMRGLSQGRATCSMEPSGYGPAPPDVLASFQ